MSAPTRDQLMANLVDMGFSEEQAASYSQRYQTLEAALEALLRDEANGSQGQSQSQAPPLLPQPPSVTPVENLEERKESEAVDYTSSVYVAWQPLRLASLGSSSSSNSSGSGSGCDSAEPVTDAAAPDAEQSVAPCEAVHEKPIAWLSEGVQYAVGGDESFEVLHACGLPSTSQQLLLRELSRTALLAAFKRMAGGGVCMDRKTTLSPHDGTSVTETGDDLSSSASPSLLSYRSYSACSSATSTPTLSAFLLTPGAMPPFSIDDNVEEEETEEDEEPECVVCLDAAKECLFLPCRHMALCSGCTSSYFARTREWNLLAAQVRADAAAEARQSAARGFSASASDAVRHKHADRANTCPSCSQTVALAIRRATVTSANE